jgi:hypothetical protein
MTGDEQTVIDYLQSWPFTFISWREVSRKADRKQRYLDNPSWALPILLGLANKEIVEKDAMGYFKLLPQDHKKARKGKLKRHVSPQILNILTRSGRNFDGVTFDLESDSPDPIPQYPKDGPAPSIPAKIRPLKS